MAVKAVSIFVRAVALCCTLPLFWSVQGGETRYQHGVMIDATEYDWCHYDCFPFDRPTLYFCVQLGDKILIGSRRADWVWMYDSSQMLRFRGKPILLRYDDRSIWIARTDGKDMRLTRDYSEDVFSNPECTAEVRKHWLAQMRTINRPPTIPSGAVLVPQGTRSLLRPTAPHFWVACRFDPQNNWNVCDIWDEKGVKHPNPLECVNAADHRGVPQRDLMIDPLATKVSYEIHLTNGVVLKDRAKARINNPPTPGSPRPQPLSEQSQDK